MKRFCLQLAAIVLGISQFAVFALADSQIRSTTFQFEKDTSPAIFINASGEGCCNYSTELEGTFTVNYNLTSNHAWVSNINVLLTSVAIYSGGEVFDDPTDPEYITFSEWLDKKSISQAVPGILSDALGNAVNAGSFEFGPAIAGSHGWNYEISTDGKTGRLTGESLFLGDDGAYFYIDALLTVVPEPASFILAVTSLLLPTYSRRRS